MCRIVKALRGELSHNLAHEYCQQKYIEHKILKKDSELAMPDKYIIAMEGNSITGTVGIFQRKEKPLPLENVFSFTPEDNSIEIGRFCLENTRRKEMKTIASRLINFLFIEVTNKHHEETVYIETHLAVIQVISKSTVLPIELHKKNANINWDKVPEESECFYIDLDPKIYQIDVNNEKLYSQVSYYLSYLVEVFK